MLVRRKKKKRVIVQFSQKQLSCSIALAGRSKTRL